MKFRLTHLTRYEYDAPLLGECFMEARLRPLSVSGEQLCPKYQVTLDPPALLFGYDQPGEMGYVNHFILRGDTHRSLSVAAHSEVETLSENPFDGLDLLAEDWAALADPALRSRWAEFLSPTLLTPPTSVWPNSPPPAVSVLQYGQALSQAIYEGFDYVPGSTDTTTPLAEFVAQRRGVCQDYAHLMLSQARAHGVPARYVSGYIYAGSEGSTHGAGATHAWVELFLPHANVWKGFDPTNNILVADRHIKVAVGRDYADVPPTKGLLRAAPGQPLPNETKLEVVVSVEKLG